MRTSTRLIDAFAARSSDARSKHELARALAHTIAGNILITELARFGENEAALLTAFVEKLHKCISALPTVSQEWLEVAEITEHYINLELYAASRCFMR